MVLTNKDYTVGWIAALDIELSAASAMLDGEEHPPLPQAVGDTNSYTLGCIGPHNIVMAVASDIGNNAAAIAATNLLRSFPNVRIGLLVGVGGGVPDPEGHDIRLGDIVIGSPESIYATQTEDGNGFVRTGCLNRPPTSLLTALKTLRANAERRGYAFENHYNQMMRENPRMAERYSRPSVDELYNASYLHQSSKADCSTCSGSELVSRSNRQTNEVHFGLIGSSNAVIKNAALRDQLYQQQDIICFEMEAAGLMNDFPCLVIRGICDYCDSHKNHRWQRYASAVAAALAKELILRVSPQQVEINAPPTRTTQVVAGLQKEQYLTTQDALKELEEEVYDRSEDDNRCLAMLRITDPRADKMRLEDVKGGLLKDAYIWILQNEEFKSWREDSDKKLLWIRGDPGKGKTMLMCGIINELSNQGCSLSYFFCQATQNHLSTAVSVLRGILFMLGDRYPQLIKHVRRQSDKSGNSIFEGENAWYTLSSILKDCLSDDVAPKITILIDALDECIEGRDQLITLVGQLSRDYPAKWIISSRNWLEIEKKLKLVNDKTSLSLEINAESVSRAVRFYIEYRVDLLANIQGYDESTSSEVAQHLSTNAGDTFLWIALACSYLEEIEHWETADALRMLPPGLPELYKRMLDKVRTSRHSSTLLQILALSVVVYRPLSMEELMALLDLPQSLLQSRKAIEDHISLCGSFLTLKNSKVQLIHQSAQDYLLGEGCSDIFTFGKDQLHHQIYVRSISKLQAVLRRNIYGLKGPGISIEDIIPPKEDPLREVRYSCMYGIQHLLEYHHFDWEIVGRSTEADLFYDFLRTHFIYWLEALSLLQEIPVAFQIISAFEACLTSSSSIIESATRKDIQDLIADAHNFIKCFRFALEGFPLQVYFSGLLFSPPRSTIKELFRHEIPSWIHVRNGLSDCWPQGLTLECRCDYPGELRFSSDGTQVMATDTDLGLVRCWNTTSGHLLTSLDILDPDPGRGARIHWQFSFVGGRSDRVLTSFDPHDQLHLWSIPQGKLLQTIQLDEGLTEEEDDLQSNQSSSTESAGSWPILERDGGKFSTDGLLFVRMCKNGILKVYHSLTGKVKMSSNVENGNPIIAVSPSNRYVAISIEHLQSFVRLYEIQIWNIETGQMVWSQSQPLQLQVGGLLFSPNNSRIAALDGGTIIVWDWPRDERSPSLLSLFTHSMGGAVIFDPHGDYVIASNFRKIQIYHSQSQSFVIKRFSSPVGGIAYSESSSLMAAFDDTAIYIWKTPLTLDRAEKLPVTEDIPVHDIYLCDASLVYFKEVAFWGELHIVSVDGQDDIMLAEGKYRKMSLSPNRCLAALLSHGSTVEIFDINQRVLVRSIEIGFTGLFDCEGFGWNATSSNITVSLFNSRELTSWSIATGQEISRWHLPEYIETSKDYRFNLDYYWSPEDTYMIRSSENSLDCWKPFDKVWENVIQGRDVWIMAPVSFSPDGKLFACVNLHGDLNVWNMNTMLLILHLPGHGATTSLSIDETWLKTDRGCWPVPANLEFVAKPNRYPVKNAFLPPENDKSWIRINDEKILWLPVGHRPPLYSSAQDAIGDRIVFDNGHGPVVIDIDVNRFYEEGHAELPPSISKLVDDRQEVEDGKFEIS